MTITVRRGPGPMRPPARGGGPILSRDKRVPSAVAARVPTPVVAHHVLTYIIFYITHARYTRDSRSNWHLIFFSSSSFLFRPELLLLYIDAQRRRFEGDGREAADRRRVSHARDEGLSPARGGDALRLRRWRRLSSPPRRRDDRVDTTVVITVSMAQPSVFPSNVFIRVTCVPDVPRMIFHRAMRFSTGSASDRFPQSCPPDVGISVVVVRRWRIR